ncbi:MAG: (deoxy)nucleoside triphosphate pyrophosphohydrolase [Clostridiales Family XIII bacterium]|jgi:8-oxo-dGTP diphosphatase|nr:(deoxy)nucleoside triphosphate pyrophosphohydrolase [Clostridiales Family XIII bacterium]
MKSIHVAAAVVIKDGRLFTTQRGYGNYAGYWEFPGGKIEPGETPAEALIREIREELNAEISIDRPFLDVEYDYPEFHLIMHCFLCSLKSDVSLREHRDARWLDKENLYSVKWLGADIEVLNALEDIL